MKRFFLVVSLFTLFFFQTPFVFAQDSSQSPSKSGWDQFWEDVGNWFSSLFGVSDYHTKPYTPSTTNDNQTNTDYTSGKKDTTTRATPDSDRNYNKGVYLKEVLDGKYQNKDIPSDDSNCPSSIKYSDMVYYFYTKSEKILYKPEDPKNPIDYDSSQMERFKANLSSNESCYLNVYNNMQDVPQGDYQGKSGGAAASSKQLNNSLRSSVPSSNQGEDITSNNSSTISAEVIIKDNDKQEETMLLNYIPGSGQSNFVCNSQNSADSRDKLRGSFSDWLNPDSWQKAADDNNEDIPASREDEGNTGGCQHGGHGRGMSQYGAQGMALSNYNYKQILTSYYGDESLGVTFSTVDTSQNKITVAMTESDPTCFQLAASNPSEYTIKRKGYCTTSAKICHGIENDAQNSLCFDTITLSLENYLKGLGEMPSSWHVEAHKAQVVAARSYSFSRTNNLSRAIKNCSYDQVFRCSKLSKNLATVTNHTTAVDATKGEILLKNGNRFSTEYSSCHGKPSLTPPYFDGVEFERIAKAPILASVSGGVCPSTISYSPTANASLVGDLYVFEGAVHGARIKERYDIANIDGGKWLVNYPGTNKKLDSRVIPAVQKMIEAVKNEVPGNYLTLGSTYRSIAEQSALWEAGLAKRGGDESENARWVARPGRSAHHTGRAIDFHDKNGRLSRSSSVYKWMLQNASKYGFYNYKLEPWHWEYNP